MDIGMLWFDDSSRSLAERVRRAVDYYTEKYGQSPTLCIVNPQTLNGGEGKVEGVELRKGSSVMPDHFWLGIDHAIVKGGH